MMTDAPDRQVEINHCSQVAAVAALYMWDVGAAPKGFKEVERCFICTLHPSNLNSQFHVFLSDCHVFFPMRSFYKYVITLCNLKTLYNLHFHLAKFQEIIRRAITFNYILIL